MQKLRKAGLSWHQIDIVISVEVVMDAAVSPFHKYEEQLDKVRFVSNPYRTFKVLYRLPRL